MTIAVTCSCCGIRPLVEVRGQNGRLIVVCPKCDVVPE